MLRLLPGALVRGLAVVRQPVLVPVAQYSAKRGIARRVEHRDAALPVTAARNRGQTPKRSKRKTLQQSAHYSFTAKEKPVHPVVLGLDIGVRNFAFCRMDSARTVLDWGVWDLRAGVPGVLTPTKTTTIETVHALVHSALFRGVDAVAIEFQMRGKMKIIEAYLHAFLYEKAALVRPHAVHQHFRTQRSGYRENKKVAVEKCAELLQADSERDFLANSKKKDDLADAYLLARFHIETLKKAPAETIIPPNNREVEMLKIK